MVAVGNPDARSGDTAAIKQTALDYIEGWYAGDAKRMENALHRFIFSERSYKRGSWTRGLALSLTWAHFNPDSKPVK
jgi:hypothetical protein